MDDFILRALAAGLILTLMTGPLGCFMVWRRLSYFGDTLAHGALLGIALSLLVGLATQLSVFLVAAGIAATLTELERRRQLSSDALLGLMSHSTLALGVVAIALMGPNQINLESLLFGDLLLVNAGDLILMGGTAIAVLGVLLVLWRPLIAATLNNELAAAEGLHPRASQFCLTLMIAAVIAVSIKLVGALLITAMLIIPAAVARGLSKSPEQMALFATAIGMLSVLVGITGSWFADTPTGPSVVLGALLLFLASQVYQAILQRRESQ